MSKDNASQDQLRQEYENRGMDSKDAQQAAERDSKVDPDQFRK
jgi:hypothetical protein